jgi:hypothetical protein
LPRGCAALIPHQPSQGFFAAAEDGKVATGELLHLIVELTG